MAETKVGSQLVKPKAILAFERHFKMEAGCCEDVFFVFLARSWTELFRGIFCICNDSSLEEKKLQKEQHLVISLKGVTFEGLFLNRNVWGSHCLLAQGKLKTPLSLGYLSVDLSDGIYLLSWAGSDIL